MNSHYYEYVVLSLINGVSFGLLLFLLSAGLTLVLSMLGVLNFAHASFYMLGAYIAYTFTQYVGFFAALLIAPVLIAVLAAALEKYILRRLKGDSHIPDILVTFGISYIIADLVQLAWGRNALMLPIPDSLSGVILTVFEVNIPYYKFFMMLVSLGVLLCLYMALYKTRLGLMIQACLSQPKMLQALGHNVPLVFTGVFAGGAALAAFAGVMAAPVLILDPSMATSIASMMFVIVIVGGLGSLSGAFFAALLLACLQTFAVGLDVSCLSALKFLWGFEPNPSDLYPILHQLLSIKLSQIAAMLPYALLIVILIIRPQGLLGQRNR